MHPVLRPDELLRGHHDSLDLDRHEHVTLSNIMLDVASTVPAGTAVNVTITSSPAITVSVTANTIAYVGRVIAGVAAQPTIYINYNNQSTGLITLTETGAGSSRPARAPTTRSACAYHRRDLHPASVRRRHDR